MCARFALSAVAAGLGLCLGFAGCNLVNSTGIQTDYSFDALEYASPTFGTPGAMTTVPDVPCDPMNDTVCGPAATALGQPSITMSCDTTLMKCIAQAEFRASEAIDLTKQVETSFPSQAIQFGVDLVDVKRVTYWIDMNTLSVATPPIDVYVADAAAHDETDPSATLLATVAAVPAASNACADPAYTAGDTKANGAPVCSAPLPAAGKAALASFVKNYKTPFQIIVHTIVIAMPGADVPTGAITFSARPTVGLKILD
jgi:hypothetical protein